MDGVGCELDLIYVTLDSLSRSCGTGTSRTEATVLGGARAGYADPGPGIPSPGLGAYEQEWARPISVATKDAR
jgi:hypothetical protein